MGILCYPQSYRAGAGGNCPTQNFVDRFETLDGDLLITEEDRRAAIEAGHYNEQNPYANRDPRLNLFIVHDGSTQTYVKGLKKGAAVNIHYNPETKTYPTTNISNTNLTFGIAWAARTMIKTAIRIQAITATNIGTDNSVPKTLPASGISTRCCG